MSFQDHLYTGNKEQQADVAIEELLGQCLLLHNDDYNTFDWVIESLIDVCNHNPAQAEQCSLIVHFKGKCSVKEGSLDNLRPLKDALINRGLNATIE